MADGGTGASGTHEGTGAHDKADTAGASEADDDSTDGDKPEKGTSASDAKGENSWRSPKGWAVFIGAITALIGALSAAGLIGGGDKTPTAAETPTATVVTAQEPGQGPTPEVLGVSVEPDGPATVSVTGADQIAVGFASFFSISTSGDLEELTWSAADFGNGVFSDPSALEQVWLEPTNVASVGRSFALEVTATTKDGQRSSASHSFTIVDPELNPRRCEPKAWAWAATSALYKANVAGQWKDFDGDCLLDEYEFYASATFGDNVDSDGDGLQDGLDVGGGVIPSLDEQLAYVSR